MTTLEELEAIESMKLELAAVYISDAVHARKPCFRIQQDDATCGRLRLTPLQVYRLTHSRIGRYAMLCTIMVHLSLAFFERPAEWRTAYGWAWTSLVELLCVAVYCTDMYLRNFSHDKEHPRTNRWVLGKCVLCGLIVLELLVDAVLHYSGVSFFRVTRVLRPYLILEKGRSMRKLAGAILGTLPRIADVVAMIVVHVIFFGFLGYLLFSESGLHWAPNPNFETLELSFLNLMILLTTANNPDVMMPSYTKTNWSVIFFVVFVLFGLYFLMNLILAVIYNEFHAATRRIALRNIRNQQLALAAAFDVLACDSDSGDPNDAQSRSVDLVQFLRLMEFIRPNMERCHALLIFFVLDRNGDMTLTLSNWSQLCEYIDVHIVMKGEERVRRTTNNMFACCSWRSAARRLGLFRGWLHAKLRTPASERFFDFLVLLNAIFVVIMFERRARDLPTANLESLSKFFLVVFSVEVALKAFAFGLRDYLSGHFHKLDCLITLSSLAAEVSSNVPRASSITVLRLFRLFRVMRTLKRFRHIFITLRQVLPAFMGLFGLLLCTYYSFALLGMELFMGKITKEEYDKPGSVLDATYWDANNYWENNFNQFTNTFVVLWDLMLVNNFHIMMEAYAAVTTRWARLYFIAFYFITVVVMLNAIVAFVLEAFISQFNRGKTHRFWEMNVRDMAAWVAHTIRHTHPEPRAFIRRAEAVRKAALAEKSRWKRSRSDVHQKGLDELAPEISPSASRAAQRRSSSRWERSASLASANELNTFTGANPDPLHDERTPTHAPVRYERRASVTLSDASEDDRNSGAQALDAHEKNIERMVNIMAQEHTESAEAIRDMLPNTRIKQNELHLRVRADMCIKLEIYFRAPRKWVVTRKRRSPHMYSDLYIDEILQQGDEWTAYNIHTAWAENCARLINLQTAPDKDRFSDVALRTYKQVRRDQRLGYLPWNHALADDDGELLDQLIQMVDDEDDDFNGVTAPAFQSELLDDESFATAPSDFFARAGLGNGDFEPVE